MKVIMIITLLAVIILCSSLAANNTTAPPTQANWTERNFMVMTTTDNKLVMYFPRPVTTNVGFVSGGFTLHQAAGFSSSTFSAKLFSFIEQTYAIGLDNLENPTALKLSANVKKAAQLTFKKVTAGERPHFHISVNVKNITYYVKLGSDGSTLELVQQADRATPFILTVGGGPRSTPTRLSITPHTWRHGTILALTQQETQLPLKYLPSTNNHNLGIASATMVLEKLRVATHAGKTRFFAKYRCGIRDYIYIDPTRNNLGILGLTQDQTQALEIGLEQESVIGQPLPPFWVAHATYKKQPGVIAIFNNYALQLTTNTTLAVHWDADFKHIVA